MQCSLSTPCRNVRTAINIVGPPGYLPAHSKPRRSSSSRGCLAGCTRGGSPPRRACGSGPISTAGRQQTPAHAHTIECVCGSISGNVEPSVFPVCQVVAAGSLALPPHACASVDLRPPARGPMPAMLLGASQHHGFPTAPERSVSPSSKRGARVLGSAAAGNLAPRSCSAVACNSSPRAPARARRGRDSPARAPACCARQW